MSTFKKYLSLHSLFLFFSISGVLSKYASFEDFLSFHFLLLYCINLVVLFVYSVLWQFILRKNSLTVVFANRAVITVWGLLWGALLFEESVSLAKAIAAVLIVVGIVIVGRENE